MNLILQSVGINYELSEYTIIQNTLHTLKHDHNFDNSTNDTDDDDEETQFENPSNVSEDTQIDQMLLQHQRCITMKHNLPSCLNGNQLIFEDEELEQDYVRAETLNGIDASRIHARLFNRKPDSDREFTPIMVNDKAQFACEQNIIVSVENSIVNAEKIMKNAKKLEMDDDNST
ncbi:15297_t:CDS:2 [Funneliformis caledonium]|uniref:15297_t:CDS:1 n=1 Tax=Funneliformis caledonium TaxID=1117310 RepID=A0A9N9E797_9GLOM|nr:15297_t:CDS:2 [Funneliformis caledonium]